MEYLRRENRWSAIRSRGIVTTRISVRVWYANDRWVCGRRRVPGHYYCWIFQQWDDCGMVVWRDHQGNGPPPPLLFIRLHSEGRARLSSTRDVRSTYRFLFYLYRWPRCIIAHYSYDKIWIIHSIGRRNVRRRAVDLPIQMRRRDAKYLTRYLTSSRLRGNNRGNDFECRNAVALAKCKFAREPATGKCRKSFAWNILCELLGSLYLDLTPYILIENFIMYI